MNTAFDIPGYDELIDHLAEEYYKRVEKMFSDMDFWESINN